MPIDQLRQILLDQKAKAQGVFVPLTLDPNDPDYVTGKSVPVGSAAAMAELAFNQGSDVPEFAFPNLSIVGGKATSQDRTLDIKSIEEADLAKLLLREMLRLQQPDTER